MALVWIYQRKRAAASADASERTYSSRWFRPAMIPVFAGVALTLAFFEEGLWDALVWRDHSLFYGWLRFLPRLSDHAVQSVVVPLLALPQATHYVIDGFIWKIRDLAIR